MLSPSPRHHAQRPIERAQHAVKLVAAAHDQAGRGDHAIGALAARQALTLLDAVDRDFAGPAKNGKHRAVFEKVDGVIAPFAGGDLAAIEAENAVELTPVERHSGCGGERDNTRGLAPVKLAWFGIAWPGSHGRLLAGSWFYEMSVVAPRAPRRKGHDA